MTTELSGPDSFNYQTVVDVFEPSIQSMLPTATHFGLTQESSYIYGAFTDADGERYVMIRRMYWDFAPQFMPLLQTTQGSDAMLPDPACLEAYEGIIIQQEADGAHVMAGLNPMAKNSFGIRRTLDACVWDEGDIAHLEGTRVGHGMQWFTPDLTSSATYLSHLHTAEGTILGKEVTGMFGWDGVFLPSGINWNTADFYRHGLGNWFVVANKYRDGSVEVGQICWSRTENPSDWGFALLQRDDEVALRTNRIKLEKFEVENDYPTHVRLDIEGEAFEWNVRPRGNMRFAELHGGPFRGADGTFCRVGGQDEIEFSFSWIDHFTDIESDSVIL